MGLIQRGCSRGPSVALASLWLTLSILGLACSSGEIHLESEPDKVESEVTATGGATNEDEDASGGTAASGGMDGDNNGGGGEGTGGQGLRLPFPCLVTEACFPFCDPDKPGCTSCDRDDDCPFVVPLCDASLDRCVECLDDHDCEESYGELFGACSLGRCVQCQRDSDCTGGMRCDDGWCGRCDNDWQCADGYDCYRDHCVPITP